MLQLEYTYVEYMFNLNYYVEI